MLYRTNTTQQVVQHLDFVGLLLFSGGLVLLLMGMEWGGGLYPRNSAHIIGALVSGAGGLVVFALWEIHMPLEEPYLPLHLFRNLPYQAASWVTSIGAMTYFAFTLIWPQAVVQLYTDLSNSEAIVLSGLTTQCFVLGQMPGPFIANWLPSKLLMVSFAIACSTLLAAVAPSPLDRILTQGLLATGILLLGMMEGIAIASTTFPLRPQEEIVTAGGLSGNIRTNANAIGTAVYGMILTNRLATTIPAEVGPAAIRFGLPPSSAKAFVAAFLTFTTPTTATVSSFSPSILKAAQIAYKTASAQANRTVFLSTLSFSSVTVILRVDQRQAPYVAGRIHKTKEEKQLEAE